MAAKVNPDLQKERNNATFKPEELTYFLDGGEWMTKRRREVGEYSLVYIHSLDHTKCVLYIEVGLQPVDVLNLYMNLYSSHCIGS